MCRSFGNFSELLCHVCRFLRLYGNRAALQAAGRIPESWTPCGTDMAITASNPSSAGTGHISMGPWVLVSIIGRWCVKLTVLVRTLKATSQIKLKDLRPRLLLFPLFGGARHWISFSSSAKKNNPKICTWLEHFHFMLLYIHTPLHSGGKYSTYSTEFL